jgi:hypothetical protein
MIILSEEEAARVRRALELLGDIYRTQLKRLRYHEREPLVNSPELEAASRAHLQEARELAKLFK